MTDTKPTLEEQIDWANALIGCDSAVAPAVLESLLELQSIRSAELPVEPAVFIHETYAAETREVEQHEVVLKSDYDTLQSALKLAQEERDEWERKAGQYMDERDKAEAELAALRGRLMDLDAKDWLDTLADADKAMSAIILEGK